MNNLLVGSLSLCPFFCISKRDIAILPILLWLWLWRRRQRTMNWTDERSHSTSSLILYSNIFHREHWDTPTTVVDMKHFTSCALLIGLNVACVCMAATAVVVVGFGQALILPVHHSFLLGMAELLCVSLSLFFFSTNPPSVELNAWCSHYFTLYLSHRLYFFRSHEFISIFAHLANTLYSRVFVCSQRHTHIQTQNTER